MGEKQKKSSSRMSRTPCLLLSMSLRAKNEKLTFLWHATSVHWNSSLSTHPLSQNTQCLAWRPRKNRKNSACIHSLPFCRDCVHGGMALEVIQRCRVEMQIALFDDLHLSGCFGGKRLSGRTEARVQFPWIRGDVHVRSDMPIKWTVSCSQVEHSLQCRSPWLSNLCMSYTVW